jgi:NitT/TauT family transport system permease protein
MKPSIIKSNIIFYILGVVFIAIIWGVGTLIVDNDYVVPSIGSTFRALFDLFSSGYTYKVLLHTLLRLFISIGVCSILGLLLGILANTSSCFKAFLKPIMALLKTLPIAVVIVLLFVMLDKNSVYYITGVVVLPIIYEACINGFENIDDNILNAVKVESKDNAKIYSNVYIPLAFPYIITGFIQAFGLGLKVLVMAEYIAMPKHSIGNEIIYYKETAIEMSYVYAWSIILIIFVLIIELLLNFIKKKLGLHKK